MYRNKQVQAGFTLIELMIVIAIIGILASVALPAYQTYTKKAKFSEVVIAVGPVRTAIDLCYQTRGSGSLANCATEAALGISMAVAEGGDYVTSVVLTPATAVITATGSTAVDSKNYILTPSPSGKSLTWADTGSSCIPAGIC